MNNLDLIYDIKSSISQRVGAGISGRIYFIATSPKELDANILGTLQMKLGYHPSGYGGPWNICVDKLIDGYHYSWNCSTSCD